MMVRTKRWWLPLLVLMAVSTFGFRSLRYQNIGWEGLTTEERGIVEDAMRGALCGFVATTIADLLDAGRVVTFTDGPTAWGLWVTTNNDQTDWLFMWKFVFDPDTIDYYYGEAMAMEDKAAETARHESGHIYSGNEGHAFLGPAMAAARNEPCIAL